ncbi:T9SS type A sorting domain-containing protein [Parasediminibacterium paludis]|uniref:T9SS type A sorting domain-containing protein n=1 Tax=Parasediminibacterium paludis TaxID=908966 RepID=A0ABV8PSW0_9BACT
MQSTVIAIIDPYDNIYSGFNKGTPNSGGIPINIPLSRPYIGKAIIYPNPATSNVTVQYKTPIAGAVVIKVYDIMGKQVLQQGAATLGANQVNTSTINISNLPKGTYTVEVNMNGAKLFSSQLIKAQ